MPFYEYRCTACQHQESFLESMDAPAQKTCPQCGKRRAFKRLVSAAGFQLKGSGWYVTDFKNNDKKPDKKSAEKTDGKADSKGEKAGEEKGSKDAASTTAPDKKADKPSGGKDGAASKGAPA